MYVKRASNKEIVALSTEPSADYPEFISNNDPDLLQFMQKNMPTYALASTELSHSQQLEDSDADLARVLEDLVELLTANGVITFTKLPMAAQVKLLNRKTLRHNMQTLSLLNEEEDDSIMP
ncbi:tryptophan synthase subunit beta like protein [Rheinheimera sp. UJ51]|uniref:tryptophan synthase subunit beta like protein n=1 Tax=unclassified Rheinheimera TaxID=115860 RepID=UPI001E351FBC|nr:MULTISPECIES: tryptophan synthase subunit beta like protein [unclassified Rheinheimera]MCC5452855.1 tryptophan synthase subunit beta like protein [Rheinheimera sp. UJ51]MCF4010548.1 tryptophan synthase subunit beta like protein [Rheinheimera sp. UJ63]